MSPFQYQVEHKESNKVRYETRNQAKRAYCKAMSDYLFLTYAKSKLKYVTSMSDLKVEVKVITLCVDMASICNAFFKNCFLRR